MKLPNIKFHEHLFCSSQVVAGRQADMEKLIGAFLQLLFGNTPKEVKAEFPQNATKAYKDVEIKLHAI
jgi:hypothetical protein